MRRIVVCGAVAAMITAASACATGHSNAKPGPADTISGSDSAVVAPTAPAGLFLAIPLPLDAYGRTSSQLANLTAAFNILDHKCMKAEGYDYPPAQFLRPQQIPATSANFMRYGEDTDQAADLSRSDFGYYQTGHRGDPDPTLSMSQAEHVAQFGKPGGKPGGCAQQASDQLSANGGDYAQPAVTVGNLDRQSFLASLEDSRVKEVIASWSACMRGRGYAVESPVGTHTNVFEWQHDERLADVACKRQVDLIRVWSGVETEIQKRSIDENAQALDLEKQRWETTVRNSASVIATSGH
ncbi:hypothetical protein GCM10009665_20950 [Kitasatospora nipponensis]|uniref:PknH-like protein n=1 Tax=Kitasatospora nipponensis TaxID=258049 RepID=A0ABP4GMH1_9ACTN